MVNKLKLKPKSKIIPLKCIFIYHHKESRNTTQITQKFCTTNNAILLETNPTKIFL